MDEFVQVVLHPALRPAFEEWLADRGLMMGQIPPSQLNEDTMPTFIVTPTQRLWDSMVNTTTCGCDCHKAAPDNGRLPSNPCGRCRDAHKMR